MLHALIPKLHRVYARYVTFAILGLTETLPDKLRSILAQAHYTYTIRKFDGEGVPFRAHCYVPELDPTTGTVFHEREDHAHLLKVGIYIDHNYIIIYTCYNKLISSSDMYYYNLTENCHINQRRSKQRYPTAEILGSSKGLNIWPYLYGIHWS